ncbi:mucin-2-like [Saccostrea cucullata]|uniref:mucin-2-like n=1 Tax=Saccostrea cuccullata TaxID=36930 RepID=UPI002ED2A774
MMERLFAVVLFIGFNGVASQGNPCRPIPFPMQISFDETSLQGAIIFTGDETNHTTQKWSITESDPSVSLQFINNTYQIALIRPVDLDVSNLNDVCNSGLEQFTQRVTCNENGTPDDEYIVFRVNPVNEYPPVAIKNNTIKIQEEEKLIPKFIARMLDYFKDRDCPKVTPMVGISKTTAGPDVSDFFTVNTTTGFLNQIKNFDYEDTQIQCDLGKSGGILNITAEDGPHNVYTILNVNFTNLDDTPPVFVNYDCSTTCYTCPVPGISVTIDYFDQGIIKTDPSRIKAIDPDTPSSNITYNLEVDPAKYIDNIEFENGSFILNQSFANFSNFGESSDFSVVVVLQAMGSNGHNSDNFTLTVNVTVPPPTTPEPTTEPPTTQPTTTEEVTSQPTSSPTTIQPSTPTTRTSSTSRPTTTPAPTTLAPIENANPDKSTDNNVLIIVLPILAALILIIVIVVIIKMRKSQPQQKYNLGEKNVNGDAEHYETPTEMDNHAFKDEKEGV